MRVITLKTSILHLTITCSLNWCFALDQSAQQLTEIISKILFHYYPECGLFIIRDPLDDYTDVVSSVLEKSFHFVETKNHKSTNSHSRGIINQTETLDQLVYADFFTSDSNIKDMETFPGLFHSHNLKIPQNFESINRSNVQILSGHSEFPYAPSVFHHASSCKLVVLFLNDIRSEILNVISKSIAPVFAPAVQKGYDPFIFITKEKLVDQLLLMEELPAKVKYKIALYPKIPLNKGFHGVGMRSVCPFCNNGRSTVVNFDFDDGQWHSTFGIESGDPSTSQLYPDYFKNMNGKLLKASAPGIYARVEVDDDNKIAKRGPWKNCIEEYLRVKFNFTYNMFFSTGKDGGRGGGTGVELPNGTWIGTVGDVAAGRADFTVVTANTPKRIHQVTFTNSFFDVGWLMFCTGEGSRVYSPLALMWPFDGVMWALLAVSTIFAFFVFWFLTSFVKTLGMDPEKVMSFARRGQRSTNQWGLRHQIFFVITSYLDQDCVMPIFQPLRCFVALWLFFTLIVTTIYRSKMVSLLAFPVMETLPKTFEELVNSKYEVGFMKHGDSAYNTLAASTDPVYVTLVKEMEIIRGFGLECLQKVVQNKRYACISYDFSAFFLIARNLSDAESGHFVFAPETTYNIFMGLGLAGGSYYKQNFEKALSWIRPFHLTNVWIERDMYYTVRLPKREYWQRTGQFDKLKRTVENNLTTLTFKHISGSFLALIFGILICAAVFISEIFMRGAKAMLHRNQDEQLATLEMKKLEMIQFQVQSVNAKAKNTSSI